MLKLHSSKSQLNLLVYILAFHSMFAALSLCRYFEKDLFASVLILSYLN